jgi:hypothetical protein
MIVLFYALLLVASVSAVGSRGSAFPGLRIRQFNSTNATSSRVFANFPAFGKNKGIAGNIEFINLAAGSVAIVSKGGDALHNFPASGGPFLWQGIS